MRPCFAFKSPAKDTEPTVLSIHDEIGFWGVQAKDFIGSLSQVKSDKIKVEINSPGGDVFAALAMYNALRGSGKTIDVKVLGVAASAASLVAMAGDTIEMPKNTFMMIHNPWMFAKGTAKELRETADTLDKIGAGIVSTYVARTGMSEDDLNPLLEKDTWLTADEAVNLGFATVVTDPVEVKASFDMARADLPEKVGLAFASAQSEEPVAEESATEELAAEELAAEEVVEPVAEQIDAVAQAAGLGEFSAVFALKADTLESAKALIATAREIKALCAVAKKPDLAGSAIRAGKSLADVRAELIKAAADLDADTHTDTAKPNTERSTGGNAKSQVTTSALWTSHKGRN